MNTKPTNQEDDPQQKALASRWGKRLEAAIKAQKDKRVPDRLKKLRSYVRGDAGDDGEKGLIRTNIIHANFSAILPQIYAKNPEIAVSPAESADDEAYAWVGGFCKTLQAVINRKFVIGGNLKKRAKSAIRSSMTTSIGWCKVARQKDIRKDPILESRIADTQDNLQRINHLLESIEEGNESRGSIEANQAEVQQQLAALQKQVESKVVSGIVIDRVLTEDMFVLDDTITDFDGYEQADAIAHRVWMSCDRYRETFGKDAPKTANKYGKNKQETTKLGDDDNVKLVAVFEVWDRVSNTIYTLCAGADEWARDPYQPDAIGERFYPFFALVFNPTDGRFDPLSDAELLIELQDEYSTTRTNFADHRRENLPTRVYRKSGDLSDADIKALTNRASNEWVGISGDPNKPIQNDIAILQNPPVDPATYDVQPILRDAEMVLGAGDAAKGTINKAKTATEAEIMAQGLQSRMADRQDVVEDWITEMAQYAAEILLQYLSKEEVQRIAGRQAVWPSLTKEQIFDLVQIEIRAGSTGKPNKNREREQWAQMLPQIQQSVTQIMQLRDAGQNDMADTVIKLMEETLRRFDERIDIEAFIPPRQNKGEAQAPIPPEVQQQMQQMQQALQEAQAQNQQLQEQASGKAQEFALQNERFDFEKRKAIDEFAAKRDEAEAVRAAKLEEVRIKAEADATARVEAERIRADLERERLASQERIEMARACSSMIGQQMTVAPVEKEASMQPMLEMMQAMQQALQSMGEQFAQSMCVLNAQMHAPKRVIRDPETGDMIGVETVSAQTIQ